MCGLWTLRLGPEEVSQESLKAWADRVEASHRGIDLIRHYLNSCRRPVRACRTKESTNSIKDSEPNYE